MTTGQTIELSGGLWSRLTGIGVSVLAHGVLFVLAIHAAEVEPDQARERWIEMAMVEREPESIVEPELAPQPDPLEPEPAPEPVPFHETVPTEPVAMAVEETPPPRRVVQGLSATSFSTGSGTGFSVCAGTTLATGADEPGMNLDDAAQAEQAVSFSQVTSAPRCRKPPLTVPDAVRTAGLEGTVSLRLDVGPGGQVLDVRVVGSLSAEADQACVDAWRRAHCRPGKQGGVPVTVVDLPHSCTYRAMD